MKQLIHNEVPVNNSRDLFLKKWGDVLAFSHALEAGTAEAWSIENPWSQLKKGTHYKVLAQRWKLSQSGKFLTWNLEPKDVAKVSRLTADESQDNNNPLRCPAIKELAILRQMNPDFYSFENFSIFPNPNEKGAFSIVTMFTNYGQTLTEFLKTDLFLKQSRDQQIATSLHVAENLLQPLTRFHKMGMVHTCIQPDNIVIFSTDHGYKVTIFDFSKISFLGNVFEGSRRDYCAPEALSGNRGDDKVDVWSVGVIFFEMMTKRRFIDYSLILDYNYTVLKRKPGDVCTLNPLFLHQINDRLGNIFTNLSPLVIVNDPKPNRYILKSVEEEYFTLHSDALDKFEPPIEPEGVLAIYKSTLAFTQAALTYDPKKRPSAEELLNRPDLQKIPALLRGEAVEEKEE